MLSATGEEVAPPPVCMTENVTEVLVKGHVAAQGTVTEIRQQVEKARVLSVTLSGVELLR